MFRIIGADGRQYGPATAEQLRQWIAQGRANAQTQVLADGAAAWQPLGTLPEFAGLFAAAPPPAMAPPKPAYAPTGQIRRTNGFATAGLVCGIVSLVFCCCYGFPFNALGIIFSLIGLVQISHRPEIYEGRGLAVAGLILSVISFLMFGLLLVVALASGHTNVQWHAGAI